MKKNPSRQAGYGRLTSCQQNNFRHHVYKPYPYPDTLTVERPSTKVSVPFTYTTLYLFSTYSFLSHEFRAGL